jgi:hypothetical protein
MVGEKFKEETSIKQVAKFISTFEIQRSDDGGLNPQKHITFYLPFSYITVEVLFD